MQAQSSKPIVLGFQLHRTGIGAAYGRWYERTAQAALKVLNEAGGIAGRPVEIVFEDDGTDPKRGAEVVERFASQNVDAVFGALFSNVVVAAAPRAGELKMPYLVCSEGHHVACGALNRWTLQPGITDVKSQVQSMAPWVAANLGKKVTMLYPDYAFGYDHRDFFTAAMQAQGGEMVELIAIPPTETSFTRYLPQHPDGDRGALSRDGRAGGADLRQGARRILRHGAGIRRSSASSTRSRRSTSPAPASSSWRARISGRAMPRYKQPDAGEHETFYRAAVGVDDNGAAIGDPQDVSTYAHMFSPWETLFVIKAAMEAAGYQGPDDRQAFVEAIEAMTDDAAVARASAGRQDLQRQDPPGLRPPAHLEGRGRQAARWCIPPSIEDGLYPDEVDYTTQPF